MAEVRQMDAKLMLAPGMWNQTQKGKSCGCARKSSFHENFRLRRCAVGADAVFDGHDAGFVLAERRVNDPLLRRDVAVNDGAVFFLHGARFPDFPQLARCRGIFGDDDEAGSFAVEAMNQIRLLVGSGWVPAEINPRAADEAGVFVALRWVADKIRRLVDYEQVGVFVNDGEQRTHRNDE